uniref:Col_cuticle_N domain-containing protein n=1 Tax=Globodera pallida TaxID=36090 RepID=A0A183CAE8_GLOPA
MGNDPDIYGIFVRKLSCGCHPSQLVATEFREVEIDLMDRASKRWSNVGRVAAAVATPALAFIPIVGPLLTAAATGVQLINLGQDITHTALEVLYKCRLCAHEVHITYEIICEGSTYGQGIQGLFWTLTVYITA